MEAVCWIWRSGHAHDRRLDLVGCRRKRCAAIPSLPRSRTAAGVLRAMCLALPIGLLPLHLVYIPENSGFYTPVAAAHTFWRASQGRTDRLRPRNLVPGLSTLGGMVRGRQVTSHPARLVTQSSSPSRRPRRLDGILHLLDHRVAAWVVGTAGRTSAEDDVCLSESEEDSSINSARSLALHCQSLFPANEEWTLNGCGERFRFRR